MTEDDYAALYHAAKRQAREAVTNQDPGSHPWLTLECAEEIQMIAAIGAAVAEKRVQCAAIAMESARLGEEDGNPDVVAAARIIARKIELSDYAC